MNYSRFTFAAALLALSACGGLAEDSAPGGDGPSSSVGTGGLAVDPRTENIFVLRQAPSPSASPSALPSPSTDNELYAVTPDGATVTPLVQLAQQADVRVLFPRDSVMVIAEPDDGSDTQLLRFDANSLALTQTATTPAQYWGTRTSPSGGYVAVADAANPQSAPINVIDTTTLAIHALPFSGPELEILWEHTNDTLVAIVFDHPANVVGNARILAWSAATLESTGFAAAEDGVGWASPSFDMKVSGVGYDLFFSYTMIAISADDQNAAIPVVGSGGDELLVVNLPTHQLRRVGGVQGPVGFTPDGTTIVGYKGGLWNSGSAQLQFFDTKTLHHTSLNVPGYEPNYFVTSEGNDVVIAPNTFDGSGSLIIYDLSSHSSDYVGGPDLELGSFASRVGHDELWIVDGGLYRLDFASGQLSSMDIDWSSRNLNILPSHNELVLDDAASGDLRLFDLASDAVTERVSLPALPHGDLLAFSARHPSGVRAVKVASPNAPSLSKWMR